MSSRTAAPTSMTRSQWSALSIRDRIRAMNETLDHVEQSVATPVDMANIWDTPKQQGNDREPLVQAATHFTTTTVTTTPSTVSEPDTTTPRRERVVDMWRRREAASPGRDTSRSKGPTVSAEWGAVEPVDWRNNDSNNKQQREVYAFADEKKDDYDEDPSPLPTESINHRSYRQERVAPIQMETEVEEQPPLPPWRKRRQGQQGAVTDRVGGARHGQGSGSEASVVQRAPKEDTAMAPVVTKETEPLPEVLSSLETPKQGHAPTAPRQGEQPGPSATCVIDTSPTHRRAMDLWKQRESAVVKQDVRTSLRQGNRAKGAWESEQSHETGKDGSGSLRRLGQTSAKQILPSDQSANRVEMVMQDSEQLYDTPRQHSLSHQAATRPESSRTPSHGLSVGSSASQTPREASFQSNSSIVNDATNLPRSDAATPVSEHPGPSGSNGKANKPLTSRTVPRQTPPSPANLSVPKRPSVLDRWIGLHGSPQEKSAHSSFRTQAHDLDRMHASHTLSTSESEVTPKVAQSVSQPPILPVGAMSSEENRRFQSHKRVASNEEGVVAASNHLDNTINCEKNGEKANEQTTVEKGHGMVSPSKEDGPGSSSSPSDKACPETGISSPGPSDCQENSSIIDQWRRLAKASQGKVSLKISNAHTGKKTRSQGKAALSEGQKSTGQAQPNNTDKSSAQRTEQRITGSPTCGKTMRGSPATSRFPSFTVKMQKRVKGRIFLSTSVTKKAVDGDISRSQSLDAPEAQALNEGPSQSKILNDTVGCDSKIPRDTSSTFDNESEKYIHPQTVPSNAVDSWQQSDSERTAIMQAQPPQLLRGHSRSDSVKSGLRDTNDSTQASALVRSSKSSAFAAWNRPSDSPKAAPSPSHKNQRSLKREEFVKLGRKHIQQGFVCTSASMESHLHLTQESAPESDSHPNEKRLTFSATGSATRLCADQREISMKISESEMLTGVAIEPTVEEVEIRSPTPDMSRMEARATTIDSYDKGPYMDHTCVSKRSNALDKPQSQSHNLVDKGHSKSGNQPMKFQVDKNTVSHHMQMPSERLHSISANTGILDKQEYKGVEHEARPLSNGSNNNFFPLKESYSMASTLVSSQSIFSGTSSVAGRTEKPLEERRRLGRALQIDSGLTAPSNPMSPYSISSQALKQKSLPPKLSTRSQFPIRNHSPQRRSYRAPSPEIEQLKEELRLTNRYNAASRYIDPSTPPTSSQRKVDCQKRVQLREVEERNRDMASTVTGYKTTETESSCYSTVQSQETYTTTENSESIYLSEGNQRNGDRAKRATRRRQDRGRANQSCRPLDNVVVASEEFITENATNVQACRSACEIISLQQIAKDLTGEIKALGLERIALTMNEQLQNYVKGGSEKCSDFNPFEEEEDTAIEVEYMGDSMDEYENENANANGLMPCVTAANALGSKGCVGQNCSPVCVLKDEELSSKCTASIVESKLS